MRLLFIHLGALAQTLVETILLAALAFWLIIVRPAADKATGIGIVVGGVVPWVAVLVMMLLYLGNLWLIRRTFREREPRTSLAFPDTPR